MYSIYIDGSESNNFDGEDSYLRYYAALYYSLKTLMQVKSDDVDVVVFYSSKNFDFKNYNYLNKFNLFKDFPSVHFIQFNYPSYVNNVYLHKWLALEKISNEFDYEKILYVDNDVFFLLNFDEVFHKYKNVNAIYGLFEGHVEHTEKLLGRPGMSSGQFFFHKNALQKIDNLFSKVLTAYDFLVRKNKYFFGEDKPRHNFIFNLLEQYAGSKVFFDEGTELLSFSNRDISYGKEKSFRVKIYGQETSIVKSQSKMIHVVSGNLFFVLPSELRNYHLQKLYDRYIDSENNVVKSDLSENQKMFFNENIGASHYYSFTYQNEKIKMVKYV